MNRATSPTGWARNPDGSPGYTWNPITGCLNHVDGLCKGGGFPCYAYKLANGRLKPLYLHGRNWKINYDPSKDGYREACLDPFYPRFWEERLYHDWGQKRGIFVCDMGELFGDWIPRKWQEDIFRLIRLHKGNRYYLLTKQPQNLIKWSPFPDNCFIGVSATNQQQFDEAVKYLKEVKATVKYISFEPLLERIKLDL